MKNVVFCLLLLAMAAVSFSLTPDMQEGLAIYKTGEGEPVLLMPYPHASGGSPMIESALAEIIVSLGHTVITFDPPGLYESTRRPDIGMDEMLECANEALGYYGIGEPIDLVGHSMGGFCALAYAIEQGERVKSLVLIGSTSGWPAVRKWGIHTHWKWWRDREFWQSRVWGTRIMLGLDNLFIHKRLDYIVEYASFADKSFVRSPDINRNEKKLPAPLRAQWMSYLRAHKADYLDVLGSVHCRTLICAGLHDPQTPPVMNEQLQAGIPNSHLVYFDKSGHAPFIEEREKFSNFLGGFLHE